MAEEMKKSDEIVTEVTEAVEVKQPEEKKETIQEPMKKRPGRKPKAQKEAEAAAANVEDAVVVEKKPARGRKAGVKKETAAKKAEGRKTTAVKKAVAEKNTASKEAIKQTVSVQFSGKSYSTEDLVKIAKDVWVYDLDGKEKDFKSVDLYVKPEENTVYYVMNKDFMGSFRI